MITNNRLDKYIIDYRKILVDAEVPENEIEQCMAWAFGDDWEGQNPQSESANRWNYRHGKSYFMIKNGQKISTVLEKIALAYRFQKEGYLIPESLANLEESETHFRKAIIKSFMREGITDLNEMMDIISWGLNYDENLLRCHTYHEWPLAFHQNTGIDVMWNTSIEKCIRLLARKWKSKRKFKIMRFLGGN